MSNLEKQTGLETIENISFSQPFDVTDTMFHSWFADTVALQQGIVANRFELSSGSVRYAITHLVSRDDAPREIRERLTLPAILGDIPVALPLSEIFIRAISSQRTVIIVQVMPSATKAERTLMSSIVQAILSWHAQLLQDATPPESTIALTKGNLLRQSTGYGTQEATKVKIAELRRLRNNSIKNGKVELGWTAACEQVPISPNTAKKTDPELRARWDDAAYT